MALPPISGAQGGGGDPIDDSNSDEGQVEELTSRVSQAVFNRVKNESSNILGIMEQYDFSHDTKKAFLDLSSFLAGPKQRVTSRRFHELSHHAEQALSSELARLGSGLEDFAP